MDGVERGAIAVVPARDEADRIAATVAALHSIPEVVRVVVVDDGSVDSTALLAVRAGASVIRHSVNRGKGAALNTAVAALRKRVRSGAMPAPQALLFADADLESSAGRLRPLIQRVLAGDAELAIGDLPVQEGARGFGVAMTLARWGIRRFGGTVVTEPLSGQRAVAWDALAALYPFAPGFGVEIAMTIDALETGLKVVEVEVAVSHRATKLDPPGIAHRFKQMLGIARELLSRKLAARDPVSPHRDATWMTFGEPERSSLNESQSETAVEVEWRNALPRPIDAVVRAVTVHPQSWSLNGRPRHWEWTCFRGA